MNWFVIKISALLIFSILITELHTLVYYIFPITANVQINLWIDRSYDNPVTVLWYIYELMNILRDAIWCYAFAMVATMVSYRLYKVLIIIFFYHITQLLFYVWNRNTSLFSNIIVYFYMSLAIIYLFIPDKKDGKIVNLEDR